MKKVLFILTISISFTCIFNVQAKENKIISLVVDSVRDIISVTDVTDKNKAVVFIGDFIISYEATTEEVTVLVVDNTTNAVYKQTYSADEAEYETISAVLAYKAAEKNILING